MDYSKWDKLELSDDEDFECQQVNFNTSPNVDKASMIRWKQAKIHQERKNRNDSLAALKLELEMWESSLKMLENHKENLAQILKKANEDLDQRIHQLRAQDWDYRLGPLEPIDALRRPDITNALPDVARAKSMIESRMQLVQKSIVQLEQEKAQKLTTDDLKEGFSKTVISSGKATKSTVEKTLTVINEPTDSLMKSPVGEGEEPLISDEYVDHFSFLKNLKDSFEFISKYPHIVTQQYSDQILAQAFRCGMDKDGNRLRNCVFQALILQYCALLGKDGIALFFKRMDQKHEKANEMFYKDVKDTIERIEKRVKEIQKEELEQEELEKQQGEQRYQLALQPDGSLKLPVTSEEDQHRAVVFDELPRKLQEGLLRQDVNLINEALSTLPNEKASELMEKAASVGLIELEEE